MKEKGFMYISDFEGLYLRKNAFKKVKFNEAKIKQYEPLIKKFAWKVYSYNAKLFFKVGFEQKDIEAIGWSYIYTFFANETNAKFSEKLDEYRVLHRHLRQRYEQLIIFTKRKVKGIVDSVNYTEENTKNPELRKLMLTIDEISSNETTPERLVLEKEFAIKVSSYLKDVLDEVYPVNEDKLKNVNLNDTEFKKICLFHIVEHYETAKKFTNSTQLRSGDKIKITKKINKFIKNAEQSYGKNDIKTISKKVNKILDMDFEA